ncbi:MAG: sigma-54 dependent transcriptional regulator [Alphaproteobacteria bacterium]
MNPDVLIVDDEADIRMLIGGILKDEGYEPRDAGDAESALREIQVRRPSLVVLDIWLQGSDMDGLDILDIVKRENPELPVVMISGHGNIETAVRAIKHGAYDYIEKPFKSDRLLQVVARAIEATRLRRENQELRLLAGPEEELIGESAAINQMEAAINRVAPSGSRVLITGPAGSGKEVVARLLHARSGRAGAPFVVLNCATMVPEHLEIAMFGTEPGFKTKDSPRLTGTFEAAHGGTLLLDEVADMPIETQGRIVRVLQEQSFERVGGNTKVEVDVRVIASTSHNLEEGISSGNFREDLFYRLNVVPITVPPLRDRREDIPLLAHHFMARSARAAGTVERQISEDAMAALQGHNWPGNVRQLRNVIEWLLIMAPGDVKAPIRSDMLPPEINDNAPAALASDRNEEIMGLSLREARVIFERDYLAAQVIRFGCNISRTAAFIGMERSALHRKLKSLGIASGERASA